MTELSSLQKFLLFVPEGLFQTQYRAAAAVAHPVTSFCLSQGFVHLILVREFFGLVWWYSPVRFGRALQSREEKTTAQICQVIIKHWPRAAGCCWLLYIFTGGQPQPLAVFTCSDRCDLEQKDYLHLEISTCAFLFVLSSSSSSLQTPSPQPIAISWNKQGLEGKRRGCLFLFFFFFPNRYRIPESNRFHIFVLYCTALHYGIAAMDCCCCLFLLFPSFSPYLLRVNSSTFLTTFLLEWNMTLNLNWQSLLVSSVRFVSFRLISHHVESWGIDLLMVWPTPLGSLNFSCSPFSESQLGICGNPFTSVTAITRKFCSVLCAAAANSVCLKCASSSF